MIRGIEHLSAVVPGAAAMHASLRDQLGLPEVWAFQDWGGFSSGGVSLGNVVLESIEASPRTPRDAGAELVGVALEPSFPMDHVLGQLRHMGIGHGALVSPRRRNADGTVGGWNVVGLAPFVEGNVFVCEYVDADRVRAGRAAAQQALAGSDGGPVGITGAREIVVGAVDVGAARERWVAMGALPDADVSGVLRFPMGPAVRIEAADRDAILAVVCDATRPDALAPLLSSPGLRYLGGKMRASASRSALSA